MVDFPQNNKLTTQQLISYMEEKGITFDYISKDEAISFLQKKNYYLKLTSYRKNYRKQKSGGNAGKYIDLDFAYLQELSHIDMELRYLILHMCLDIEHYLKVSLLQSIENNPYEDGYHIVNVFLSQRNILDKLKEHNNNSYSKDLIKKYVNTEGHPGISGIWEYDIPIWVFVELISFGNLTSLCEVYYNEYKDKSNRNFEIKFGDHIFLNSVRDLRNACAHSNCLINNLNVNDDFKPHGKVSTRLEKMKILKKDTRRKKLKNPFLYDFVCLLFTYCDVVADSDKREESFQKLKNLFENPEREMLRHAEWFKKNDLLKSSYVFCKTILDNLYY